MNRASNFVYRGAILTAVLAIAFAAGCGKKTGYAAANATAPGCAAAAQTDRLHSG